MNSSPKKSTINNDETAALQQKIAALEKQLQWEKLRADEKLPNNVSFIAMCGGQRTLLLSLKAARVII